MRPTCSRVGRLSAVLLGLSACGSTPPSVTTSHADPREARGTPTAEQRVHPLEEARLALLSTPPDTPHYAEVLAEVRARLDAMDLSHAPEPTSAMTCALARSAAPLRSLHASGVILWNGAHVGDPVTADDRITQWCAVLAAWEQTDCSEAPEDGDHWTDLCRECEDGGGPSLADRRRARAHGVAACAAWEHLRARCAADAVLSRADALRFAEASRYEAEAVFEAGSCWENRPDTDPADDLGLVIERLEELAGGEPEATE
ncbi:MAG: hypothetical protein J0L92_12180 [Deltaproteobacteria bacterium]|nr:hypothetical protein [Deltaproteobacteria bacterium]